MKSSEADIIIVPGFADAGDGHWQARWAARLSTARQIALPDPDRASPADWAAAIDQAIKSASRPVVLVAHSIGVAAVAHAAANLPRSIAGAFLVGMADSNHPDAPPALSAAFAPLPRAPLPFPSMLIASRTDPYCDYDVAAEHANAWGSDLVDAGDAGHLDAASGHGPWPEGLLRFASFLRRL